MTKDERITWELHRAQLKRDVDEYNHYDAGYTYKQKQKFSKQRESLIRSIKQDITGFSPFAEIARNNCNSPFCFDECYDSMDGDMERTIREIMNYQFED